MKKVFVFLATGDQGASVCRYLVQDGFEVIGLTRNPESDKAKALEKLGVKMVKGDMSDPASYKPYLKGIDGAFINADFWEKYFSSGLNAQFAYDGEKKNSTDAFDACNEAGVGHIIYSTLDKPAETRPVPHFDSKASVSQYIKSLGVPATHVYTSYYMSNCVKFGGLKKEPDGSFVLSIPAPDKVFLPSFAVEQTGGWVLAAFKNPAKWKGKDMFVAGDNLTIKDMAKVFSEVTGKTFRTMNMTDDQFLGSGKEALQKQITEELWQNYNAFYHNDILRDVEASRQVYPEQWDTRTWAQNSEELKAFVSQ